MVELYLGYILLIIVHELGHISLLKVYKVGVVQVSIGNALFFRIGNVRVSPFVISGSTSFSGVNFEKLSISSKVLVISAGPIANFLAGVVLSSTSEILSSIAFFMTVLTLLPIPYLDTDGWCITKEVYNFFSEPRRREG